MHIWLILISQQDWLKMVLPVACQVQNRIWHLKFLCVHWMNWVSDVGINWKWIHFVWVGLSWLMCGMWVWHIHIYHMYIHTYKCVTYHHMAHLVQHEKQLKLKLTWNIVFQYIDCMTLSMWNIFYFILFIFFFLVAGYTFPVDWWSLGVVAYEMRGNVRPFSVHSNTALVEVKHILSAPIHYPRYWSHNFIDLITKVVLNHQTFWFYLK